MESRSIFAMVAGAGMGLLMGYAALSLASPESLHSAIGTKPSVVGLSSPVFQTKQMSPSFVNPGFEKAPEPEFASSSEVGLKNMSIALLAFGGMMAAFNAVVLSFYNQRRTSISLAAMSSEKDEELGLNRRQALLGASAIAGMTAASPAQALFGWGEDANQVYVADTTAMLNEIKSVLVLDNADPAKQDKIITLRKDMNAWVAKYRRDPQFSGRASYGNLYSVINAVAGHYTNFGTKTPIPKKRAGQIVTEIAAAEQLLSKGR